MRPGGRLRAGLLAGAAAVLASGLGAAIHHAVRAARPSDLDPPPPAERVATFRHEEVRFTGAGNTLAGTLTLPTSPGPHPAVVFLNGSDGADRTANGRWPPIWRHFASHGFASLSWDRPGVGGSAGDFEMQTFDDRAEEALAAVHLLRTRDDIRRDAVGLWGFSQGGAVIPLAASRSADVAFVIQVSGSQVLAWQQDLYRVEAELRADDFPAADVAAAVAFARRRMDLIRNDGSFEELEAAQQAVRGRPWFEYVHYCDRARFESGKRMVWHDPGPSWEGVRCPVLALFGEKDTSCPVEPSIAVVRRGLERAGNRDVTVTVFPRAGHAITVTDTGGRKEARQRAEAREKGSEPEFAPGYLETMSSWLRSRFGPRH